MKQKIKYIVFMIIGAVAFTGIGVTAATVLNANQISYTNSKTTATDVQGAIDDLYSKVKEYHETLGHIGIIYYNPVTGARCTENQYNTDLQNYKTTNNKTTPTGQNTGCMKWYAYKDNGDGTVNMILDHNTTAKVAYNSSNSNATCKEACTQLASDTSNWKNTARMITGQEIADITGNTSWNTSADWFYLDSNSKTQIATSQNASKYSWLYDYIYNCTRNGCNTADSSTFGYWTSSKYVGSSVYVWNVGYGGGLDNNNASITNFGVRPVITVSKV